MRPLRTSLVALGVLLPLGCGGDSSGPSDQGGNLRYTARVERVQTGTINFVTVIVSVRNTTSAVETRTYPSACPVQIRLYRLGDDALVYDETRRDCPATPTSTLEVGGLQTKELQSGLRNPTTILGDSIAAASYGVRAVVNTEGNKLIIVNAGTVNLSSN